MDLIKIILVIVLHKIRNLGLKVKIIKREKRET
jgi:hypothetical protein